MPTNKSIEKLKEYLNELLLGYDRERAALKYTFDHRIIGKKYYDKKSAQNKEEKLLVRDALSAIIDQESCSIYDNFQLISCFIGMDRFTPKDCVAILLSFIRNNIFNAAIGNIENVIDLTKIEEYEFESMPREKVQDLIATRRICDLQANILSDATEEELRFLEELLEKQELFKHDYSDRLLVFLAVYFDYRDMVNNEGIEELLEDFKKLEVEEDVINKIRPYLESLVLQRKTNPTKGYSLIAFGDYILTEEDLEEDADNKKESTQVKEEIKETKKEKNKSLTLNDILGFKILNEKAVKLLKKYIKQFFDLYRVEIIQVPKFEELINCLKVLEKLESSKEEIGRFLSYNLEQILTINSYVNTYQELITLVHYMIKYDSGEKYINPIIRKYKHLKPHYENPISEVVHNIDEYTYYDEGVADDVKELLGDIFVTDKDNYELTKELFKEYINYYKRYEDKTDYIYSLAKK